MLTKVFSTQSLTRLTLLTFFIHYTTQDYTQALAAQPHIKSYHAPSKSHKARPRTPQSPSEHSTTAIFYMAADNDLYPFSERNIRQIRTVIAKFDEQAKKRLKIAIHIDMHRPGQPKITRRYYVDKQHLVQVGKDMSMDSGDHKHLSIAVAGRLKAILLTITFSFCGIMVWVSLNHPLNTQLIHHNFLNLIRLLSS